MKSDGEKIKKNKGKQKIEIKKIEENRYCQITFSKRKEGIMKKANEIRALCNINIDLIMYSSSGKPYYYGDSSLKTMKIALSNEQQFH
ncbi:hypothetical protein AHAS_Ahas13G0499400 [Arachis hypogaea]|uniref:MADS-box domain-containing protein n=1 Tax=Arachis hypogaea TaxID=3818 RepID=A0A444ZSZ4_ARAHY|nr:hypothetical protein Ahy_B03g062077 [Arachis hypogaea]